MDFLAYLFPGILATLGIFLLLLLTPLNTTLVDIPPDLAAGILFSALSYIVGVILSGFSEFVARAWRIRRRDELKGRIVLPEFQNEIIQAFNNLFNATRESKSEWSLTHFYICRSLVFEYMPTVAQVIQRQNSLRQLRTNMILPIMIWLCVGLGWGIHDTINNELVWGTILIVSSVVLSVLIVWMLVNRMNDHEEREARETLTAFLAGYKVGTFSKSKPSD